MYEQAYESYTICCEKYGMESVNFQEFIAYLTEDQIIAYSNLNH